MQDEPRRTREQTNHLRTVARRHVRALLESEGGRCHWCHAPLVQLNTVGPVLEGRDAAYVYWTDEHGNRWRSLYATIDHVIPLRDYPPGRLFKHRFPPSSPLNLVVSCAPCNRSRTPEVLGDSSPAGVDIRSI